MYDKLLKHRQLFRITLYIIVELYITHMQRYGTLHSAGFFYITAGQLCNYYWLLQPCNDVTFLLFLLFETENFKFLISLNVSSTLLCIEAGNM